MQLAGNMKNTKEIQLLLEYYCFYYKFFTNSRGICHVNDKNMNHHMLLHITLIMFTN